MPGTSFRRVVASAAMMAVVVAQAALAEPDGGLWSFETVGRSPGEGVTAIWSDQMGSVYAWTSVSANGTTEARLYHRLLGSWKQVLLLSGSQPGQIWAPSPGRIYASSYRCSGGNSNCSAGGRPELRVLLGGKWLQVQLPPDIGTSRIRSISGDAREVYLGFSRGVLHRSGTRWISEKVPTRDSLSGSGLLAYVGPDEVYSMDCWGHARRDDGGWHGQFGFDFCDIYGVWAMRDGQRLEMYAAGNNNFGNGIMVWRYQEGPPGRGTWGCKSCTAINDRAGKPGSWASALGIWGSAPNDIWVVGTVGADGRIWRSSGNSWRRDARMGPIPRATAVHGTSDCDVWVSLSDGRVLHYNCQTLVDSGVGRTKDGSAGS